MVRITAQATTGSTGLRLIMGFDPAGITPMSAGEGSIDHWARDVSYLKEATLEDILDPDTKDRVFQKFGQLALNVYHVIKDMNQEVQLFASGHVREIRVVGRKTRCFRSYSNKFLGERK
jgi:hypothetical protein